MLISIYDARELKLSENDPLFQVLFYAYECHVELEEIVATKAASLLGPLVQVDEAISMAEEELNV